MGSVRVSSCRCCVFVSVVHPVAILSVVFCVICSLMMFMSDSSGDHMVKTYSSMGLVMDLYVAMIVSFCFSHTVDVSVLSTWIVLCALVVVIYTCLLYVSSKKTHPARGWNAANIYINCLYTIPATRDESPIRFLASRPLLPTARLALLLTKAKDVHTLFRLIIELYQVIQGAGMSYM